MHRIMAELHQDHIHLARVLEILEQQVQLLSTGGDADLFLMIDIAEYFQHYPDLVHHPKENKVYEVFKKRTTKAVDIVESLLQEHWHLPSVTVEFHNMLEKTLNESELVSRQELQDNIQEFVDIQKRHMHVEEGTLFPLIEKTLSDEDWDNLEKAMIEKKDPLFGSRHELCYENLYQSIILESSVEEPIE